MSDTTFYKKLSITLQTTHTAAPCLHNIILQTTHVQRRRAYTTLRLNEVLRHVTVIVLGRSVKTAALKANETLPGSLSGSGVKVTELTFTSADDEPQSLHENPRYFFASVKKLTRESTCCSHASLQVIDLYEKFC